MGIIQNRMQKFEELNKEKIGSIYKFDFNSKGQKAKKIFDCVLPKADFYPNKNFAKLAWLCSGLLSIDCNWNQPFKYIFISFIWWRSSWKKHHLSLTYLDTVFASSLDAMTSSRSQQMINNVHFLSSWRFSLQGFILIEPK